MGFAFLSGHSCPDKGREPARRALTCTDPHAPLMHRHDSFLRKYYTVMANSAEELIKFYKEESSFAHLEGACVRLVRAGVVCGGLKNRYGLYMHRR